MPSFDAQSILEDPEFKTPDGFLIRRYSLIVSDEGVGTRTHVDIPAVGVIVPIAPGGSVPLGVVRTPEVERQGNNITVYTQAFVSTGSAADSQPADDIIWHDQLYQVTSQNDWFDFGYNEVSAVLQEPGGRNVV